MLYRNCCSFFTVCALPNLISFVLSSFNKEVSFNLSSLYHNKLPCWISWWLCWDFWWSNLTFFSEQNPFIIAFQCPPKFRLSRQRIFNLLGIVHFLQKRAEIWHLAAACGSRFVWWEEFAISSLFAAAVVKQPAVVGSRSLELFLLLVLCFCHLPSLPLGRSPSAKVQRVLL